MDALGLFLPPSISLGAAIIVGTYSVAAASTTKELTISIDIDWDIGLIDCMERAGDAYCGNGITLFPTNANLDMYVGGVHYTLSITPTKISLGRVMTTTLTVTLFKLN